MHDLGNKSCRVLHHNRLESDSIKAGEIKHK